MQLRAASLINGIPNAALNTPPQKEISNQIPLAVEPCKSSISSEQLDGD